MTEFDGSLALLVILFLAAYSVNHTHKHRRRIRERANREYQEEIEITADELESRLGDSELLYEELEQTYWIHSGVLIGICVQLYWHTWAITIVVGLSIAVVGVKYLTLRPFSSGTPSIE